MSINLSVDIGYSDELPYHFVEDARRAGMPGTCRLCRNIRELRDSHYLPAGVYRRLRGEVLKNPNPILITPDVAFQTSDQFREPLLCGDCEQLFSRKGERWVLTNMAQGEGRFPLYEAILQTAPFIQHGDMSYYRSAEIPGADPDALAYFGISVFWRGAAHEWRHSTGVMPSLTLGPFEERLRLFLLDQAAFPDHVALTVTVWPSCEPLPTAYTPYGHRRKGYGQYRFYIPGIEFDLWVGNAIPDRIHNSCIIGGPERVIMTSPAVEFNTRKAFRLLARTARRAANVERTIALVNEIKAQEAGN